MTNRNRQSGFTLLETLLAIGILSVVIVQVISVQSTNVAVTQIARDNIQATWAMRQAQSQLEYVLDTLGVPGLPKAAPEFEWKPMPDDSYVVKMEFKDVNVKPSEVLITALKLAMGKGEKESEGEGEGGNDPTKGLKDMASMLDAQLPKDMYKSYVVSVTWKQGDGKSKQIDSGGFIIDEKVIEGLAAAGNASGGPSTPSTSTSTSTNVRTSTETSVTPPAGP